MIAAHKTPPRLSLMMTRNDDHLQDALPTQKLEWVTPKISLMGAGDTTGAKFYFTTEQGPTFGPS
jgi:hypothetical protein